VEEFFDPLSTTLLAHPAPRSVAVPCRSEPRRRAIPSRRVLPLAVPALLTATPSSGVVGQIEAIVYG
jgi:hypothetical protein